MSRAVLPAALARVVVSGGAAVATRIPASAIEAVDGLPPCSMIGGLPALLPSFAQRNHMIEEAPRDYLADRADRLRVILRAILDRQPLILD